MKPPEGARLRVLLVEDSPDDAELIEIALRRHGYDVVSTRVETRAETERALTEGEWDIILTDHALPGFSAHGVLELLDALQDTTPCLVVSGAIGEEAAVSLLKAGAVDYVNKRRLNLLPTAVERTLREAEERRARRAAEAALRESEERFRLIAENANDLIGMINMAGRFVYVSPSFRSVFGYSEEELLHTSPLELMHPDDRARHDDVSQMEHYEVRMRDAHGEWRWIEGSSSVVSWHGEPHLVTIARDISSQKEMTERLKEMAFFDPLSGLPNRVLLHDRLNQALAHAQRVGRTVAVMFLDLDNFKVVNDSLGHETGDRVLKQAASVISGAVREEDTVARLGGDEFVVVLPAIDTEEDAARVARKLLQRIREPLQVDDNVIRLGASVGIALAKGGRGKAEDMLKHADLAMYLAKESGKGQIRFYSPGLDDSSLERLNLERDLRVAVERDEFVLHYQPQLDLATLRITGMEALARWEHPKHGLMGPDTFIPLAEETGLIRELGEIVLRKACRQMVAWRDAGLPLERMAVNLSSLQLTGEGIVQLVADVLEDTGLEPERLELEITESVTMSQGPEVIEVLNQLKELGVSLAVDDFGTGYSSLSYLKRLPMDTLKVDRELVSDLCDEDGGEQDAAILRAVIELGRHLQLRVVGEGIERVEQLQFLTGSGLDEGQGFLLGRPLPGPEAVRLLQRADWGLSGD